MAQKYTIEITVAVIAGVAVLGAALISNFDKLSQSNAKKSEISYVPSNDIDLEIRHHLDLIGVPDLTNQMKQHLAQRYREKFHLKDTEIACILDTSFFASEFTEVFVAASKKYLSLQDVQELNKFYSSPVMKHYLQQQSAIAREIFTAMDELGDKKAQSFATLVENSRKQGAEDAAVCPVKQ